MVQFNFGCHSWRTSSRRCSSPPSSCWCRPHTVIAWPYHASHPDLPTATSSRTPDCPDCRLDPPRRSPEPPPGPITPVVVLLAPPTVTAPATDLQGRSVVLPSYSPYIIDRHSPELVSPPGCSFLLICNFAMVWFMEM
jgi:hypothetical protein